MLECTLDDVIDLPLAPTGADKPARIRAETVTWTTDPEHAGEFTKKDDPATGARFKPRIEGEITIAVAAQNMAGKVIAARVQLRVTGVEANELNLSAKLAPKETPAAAGVLDASVETAQH